MNDTIACCGLLCQSCQIYLAARGTDKIKKEKMIYDIISKCKIHYGVDYKYEEINECYGCKSENSKVFFGCLNCKIRECVINKEIENCAYCEEYICEKLEGLFKSEPNSKTRLDLIRGNL